MRKLKNGEVKYKQSAYRESSRLSGNIQPMDFYVKGSHVKVYMGCGWATGWVQYSDKLKCCVFLSKGRGLVTCVDNRNITKFVEQER